LQPTIEVTEAMTMPKLSSQKVAIKEVWKVGEGGRAEVLWARQKNFQLCAVSSTGLKSRDDY
jgi:hypothetical protein